MCSLNVYPIRFCTPRNPPCSLGKRNLLHSRTYTFWLDNQQIEVLDSISHFLAGSLPSMTNRFESRLGSWHSYTTRNY